MWFNIRGAEIIDPMNFDRMDEMVDIFCELRKSKGVTPEQARGITELGSACAEGTADKVKEVKLMSEHPDVSAAELIIDGCNMGIRSIYKYFNKYPAADAEIKRLVDDIVKEEEDLSVKLRKFL